MLDFTKIQKKVLNIKLIDGNEILVRMPTKKIFDTLMDLQSNLDNLKAEDKTQVALIYDLVAQVLSNNLLGKKIENKYIEELLDIEDVTMIFQTYMNFVNGSIASDPNSASPQSQERTEG